MRHLQTGPTWHSHGLFRTCGSPNPKCDCLRTQRSSTIDNAYCSIHMNANIKLLDDTIADHKPLLVTMNVKTNKNKSVLESRWCRDLRKVQISDFEAALQDIDWSPIFLS